MSEDADSAVRIESLGRGAFRVTDARGSRLAYAEGPASACWVFLDGHTWVVDTTDSSGAVSSRQTEDALSAPMPATVLRVDVSPGQRVARGDVVVVLEAMKMELAISSPRDGIVRAVACRPGELVQPGHALVELE